MSAAPYCSCDCYRPSFLRRLAHAFLFLILTGIGIFLGVTVYNTHLSPLGAPSEHVAVVRLHGTIGPDAAISARKANRAITEAFKDKQAKGVLLLINSPGGTPVQSSLIHDQILRLRKKHPKTKVVVVGEDMLTSGAYFIASAADKIYVNRSTIVGSIGVIMRSFGFTDLMDKLGVERRVLTAGKHKSQLDPFSPLTPEMKEKTAHVLNTVHQHFIEAVREGRGARLKETPELFSGDYWVGQEALDLGLVDGFGSLESVLEEEFKTTRFREYEAPKSLLEMVTQSSVKAVFDYVTQSPVAPVSEWGAMSRPAE